MTTLDGTPLYIAAQWQSLAGITVVGQTPSIVGGAIRLNPTSVSPWDSQAIEFPVATSNGDARDLQVVLKASGASYDASAYGIAIGWRSISFYPYSICAQWATSPSPNAINFWPQLSGAPANKIAGELPITGNVSPGDVVRLTLSMLVPTIGFRIENLKQGTNDYREIVGALGAIDGASWDVPNTSVARISAIAGQFDVLSVAVVDRQPVRPDLAAIGDSKTVGKNAGSRAARYASRLPRLGRIAVFAGGGDRTSEVLACLPAILAVRPRQALLSIGRNDLYAGVAPTVWQANYRQIVATLQAAGLAVVHLLPIPETTQDQSSLRTFISANYTDTIDPAVGWVNATHLSWDGIHPSPAGHALIAAAIDGSTLLASAVADGGGGSRSMGIGF